METNDSHLKEKGQAGEKPQRLLFQGTQDQFSAHKRVTSSHGKLQFQGILSLYGHEVTCGTQAYTRARHPYT